MDQILFLLQITMLNYIKRFINYSVYYSPPGLDHTNKVVLDSMLLFHMFNFCIFYITCPAQDHVNVLIHFYEKKIKQIVNNVATNINKTDNHLPPQLNEH